MQVAREEARKEACSGLLLLGKVCLGCLGLWSSVGPFRVALLLLLLLLTYLLTLHRRDHVQLRQLQRHLGLAQSEATELRGLRAEAARGAQARKELKEQDRVMEEMGQQLEAS